MTHNALQLETRNSELETSAHRLIVFSDDWGRHPSSCQHLIGQLLPRYQTLWVNTIGTRSPRLSWEDFGKAIKKIGQWIRPPAKEVRASVKVKEEGTEARRHEGTKGGAALRNLTVVSPKMFPGFRRAWQRKLNRRLIVRAIHKALGPRLPGEVRTAITTIPITADLPKRDANDDGGLDVDRWVYYCVDDFSVWPGLDGSVLDAMDQQMALRADAIVAVSQTLRDRIAVWGRESVLLTHGIDLEHWGKETGDRTQETGDRGQGTKIRDSKFEIGNQKSEIGHQKLEIRNHQSPAPSAAWVGTASKPIFLFWGVVDQRLDVDWCLTIADKLGTLILLGPQQSPSPRLMNHPRILMPGPAPYDSLPALAAAADVLVMPYADLPVTRAIQPLKFKEYLATGKPVIARALPATVEWADAADVLDSIESLLAIAPERLAKGVPASQMQARTRLADESWGAKAAVLEGVICDPSRNA